MRLVNRTTARRLAVLLFFVAALVAGLSVAFAGGESSSARAASSEAIAVTAPAGLQAVVNAAGAGETIELAPGTYGPLSVDDKKGVTITGPREARLDGIAVDGSTDVTIQGVSITPSADARAEITIRRSANVVVSGVLIDGRDETIGAGIVADRTVAGVTLRDSEVTNCGEGQRCVEMDFTSNVKILGNTFRDCMSCDFIRGRSGMTITGNTFDRAVVGRCEAEGRSCAHNDIIQVMGGGPWTITRNRFGDSEHGGGAVFISLGRGNEDNPIHDVLVASNVFIGSIRHFAVHIGGEKAAPAGLIRNLSIVNNTILSGNNAAISLSPAWATVPAAERPLVANNVFGRLRNRDVCNRGRFVANIVVRGSSCPGATRGQTALDADGAPTKTSAALIDKAVAQYAPKLDHLGERRSGRADIGAIEYRG
jgi:Right handed beta helix region